MKGNVSIFILLCFVSMFLSNCTESKKKDDTQKTTESVPDSSSTGARGMGGVVIVIDNPDACPPTTTVNPTSVRMSSDKKSATVNWTTQGAGTYAVMYKILTGSCNSCTQYQSGGWISQVCPEGTTNTYTVSCLCADATYEFKVAYYGEDFSCTTKECSCE